MPKGMHAKLIAHRPRRWRSRLSVCNELALLCIASMAHRVCMSSNLRYAHKHTHTFLYVKSQCILKTGPHSSTFAVLAVRAHSASQSLDAQVLRAYEHI